MNERTGYSEKRYEEHPPGRENLPEIQERLQDKAGNQKAAIWPGAEREEARLLGEKHHKHEGRTGSGPQGNSTNQNPLQGHHIPEPARGQVGCLVRPERYQLGIRIHPNGKLAT